MAKGLSMDRARFPKPKAFDIAIGNRLDRRDAHGVWRLSEQMCEALLQLQILSDGYLPADLGMARDLAMLGLEQREQPGLDGEACNLDRVRRLGAPAQGTGHMDVNVPGALDGHCIRHLAL